ncbi:Cu(I)/Ag(I) efflux system membrane protein CusB [Pseudoalteromonas carrageenovora]|uniref:Cu(I)/Ag(I) efflux system membrane protein CusB/SilB n=1 Tax=Pseudoalteromonas carrageenovora IAM 12662 TaxID=1314868 RepID=A0A2K4XCY3_PSEVC|nr:efflux RND transporter periplasmic adaptor subunit [Pseudoalteromonas carrageenovora]MBE0381045.1 Cu(I)/Ag(I) efflux system membrane protein CusB/SilB [Pseudoalteromonas carrageenovora IAM 12662]QBJ73057.1 Cu(I)/Ag(I) efflux system membrane protein CusB [Pseudoalteromonas carrageenovora]GEB70024.1 copper transporter [Pseudoalteromonas carrageenovora]SOU42175.1 Hemolysin D [Pseudoalteromonas carrageenovora IAM 12662]
MNTNLKLLIAGAVGAGVLAITQQFLTDSSAAGEQQHALKEPLYWVAPMDSNYKRDEPGLSPMGMDLVPVYKDDANSSPGTVTISPEVVNNLGVRTSKVQLKTLQSDINTVGYVQYNQDQLIHIHPRVEGWLETLFVKAQGAQVKAGEPLYTLYSPQLVNAQEEFLLAVNRNNTVLIRAAKARLESLNVSDGFIQRLQNNKKVMQNITFYARESGVVDELNVREGFFVKPGTSMMSIAQLDEVWVEAEVFERQVEQVSVGLPVTMTLDYLKGEKWQGKVDYIYPALDAKNRTLRVRLRFNNKDHRLKPNMFAQVSIHSSASEAHLTVPKEAVIRTQHQNRVVIAKGEGRYKSVQVDVGHINSSEAVILSGVLEGDTVVISAQFLIDSESSKSSDFKRMDMPNLDARPHSNMNMDMKATMQPQTATVNGTINAINLQNRVINISREAIPKWSREPATMDFILSAEVDISQLKHAQYINFTFSIINDEFVVTDIKVAKPNSHSTMQHSSH